MILLIGSNGNMGRRYSCILNFLGVSFFGADLGDGWPVSRVDKVIIATPSNSHRKLIQECVRLYPQADILCEKPVVMSLEDLEALRPIGNRIYCVNQYAFLTPMYSIGGTQKRSVYNYFKHGDDGLPWDCFQMFALADGDVALSENSFRWTCYINGKLYSISDMDDAYLHMMMDFLGPMQKVWGWEKIETTTKRVLEWISENGQSNPA